MPQPVKNRREEILNILQRHKVGETFKKIDNETQGALLTLHPEINWKGVKGVRDVLSHNYFNIDAEEIFYICRNNLEPLKHAVFDLKKKLMEKGR